LAKSFREGYVYTGQYSEHRKRFFGAPACRLSSEQFVAFTQNHDQVGNRAFGERLSALADFEQLKLAAGAMLLAPYLPLIFMGEEYGEGAPFLYFVSHSDPALQAAVREGRKAEFACFRWQEEPPDPNEEGAFSASKLRWEQRTEGRHATLLGFYRRLIELRRRVPALRRLDWKGAVVTEHGAGGLLLRRRYGANEVAAAFNFGGEAEVFPAPPGGVWAKTLDSAAAEWGGPGSSLPEKIAPGREIRIMPHSFALLERDQQPARSS
jgi:maltooligosyltrehalose trehalohydrolase